MNIIEALVLFGIAVFATWILWQIGCWIGDFIGWIMTCNDDDEDEHESY